MNERTPHLFDGRAGRLLCTLLRWWLLSWVIGRYARIVMGAVIALTIGAGFLWMDHWFKAYDAQLRAKSGAVHTVRHQPLHPPGY